MAQQFVLTVDVEPDRPPLPEEEPKPLTYRGIELGMPILLDLLDQFHCRATFFTLGETAERFPALVPELARRGHEVACHTYRHRDCSQVNAEDLADDVARATGVLRRQTTSRVVGFRFPFFRANRSVLPRLRELEFRYDISLLEFGHEPDDYVATAKSLGLQLFRNTRVFEAKRRMHVRYGGWMLRQKPKDELLQITRDLLAERSVINFYIHPWEFISLPSKVNVEDYFDPLHVQANFAAMLEECARQRAAFVPLSDLLSAEEACGGTPS